MTSGSVWVESPSGGSSVRRVVRCSPSCPTVSGALARCGQRLRHFAVHVTATAGTANDARVRRWVQDQKAGWYAVLADPQMPVTSALLDQAHDAIERQLFAMKGFRHPRR